MSFVHLRNHTGYSFLSGAMDIDSMLLKAKGFGMKSIAITDRNSMYGIVPFYKAALGYGIKPLLGSVFIDSYGNALTLIALTREGYTNISSLLTRFNLSKGDVDIDGIEFLQSSPVHGIAVLTGGFDGKIWKLVQAGKIDQVKSILKSLRDFIPELYIEVQITKCDSEKSLLNQLHSISRSLGIPAVLTSSNNSVNRSDYTTIEILAAIKEHRRFGINASGKHLKDLYLKSARTMKRLACGWDELVKNTLVIADKADVDLELGKFHLPEYPDAGPGGADEFLRMVCIGNLGRYYCGPARRRASTCLGNELEIIKNKGLSGYFLIVSDIIRYSRKNGIPVGPGRGSAASSIVSYLTGITTVDPIKFNLYFERFLNPERTQLPDIDIDFGHRERDRVFAYARKKYGVERVAHIATISHFGWRGSVRESAKVLGLGELEITRLTRFFPMYSHGTLQDIIDEHPALQKMLKGNKKLLKIMEFSSRLFGLPRNPSIHASGFIISDQPLYNYAPLEYSENGEIIIQITKNEFEDFGLLKLDCLGLRYLSVIYDSVTEISGSKFPHLVLEKIPLDDKAAFDMLSAGDGVGVFQLESGGIRDLLKKVKVRKFKDIYEVLALYRPGPLEGGMIPKYLKNRGKKKFHAVFDDEKFYEILKDTYGIIVFQEQVMKIAEKIAGFSLGEAEILRKSMGKRNPDLMKTQKGKFINGAVKNGYSLPTSEKIFETLLKFSGYGFNKAHAVSYGYIAYWCAYLKTHYPAIYYTALLNAFLEFGGFIQGYIFYIERKGLNFLMPGINQSQFGFSTEDRDIRIGLISLKGIGSAVVKEILTRRDCSGGSFLSIEHFCSEVRRRVVSKNVMEILVSSGTFREFGKKSELLLKIEKIWLGKQNRPIKGNAKQLSFFGDDVYRRLPGYTDDQKQGNGDGQEYLDFIISDRNRTYQKIDKFKNIKAFGFVTRYRSIRTKKGRKMAFFTLESDKFSYECILFPDAYKKNRSLFFGIEGGIEVFGKLELNEGLPKILVKKINAALRSAPLHK